MRTLYTYHKNSTGVAKNVKTKTLPKTHSQKRVSLTEENLPFFKWLAKVFRKTATRVSAWIWQLQMKEAFIGYTDVWVRVPESK
jgi:hypothetical protein